MTLLLGATVASAAPPDVKHLYPAGAQVGQTIEIAASAKLPVGTRVWCSRDDLTFELSADKDKADRFTVTVPATAPPGLCWLRFYNDDGAAPLRPFFIGTFPEILETEPNDSLGEAQPLASSRQLINGILARPGDVDTFAVSLKKGETLVASMEANRTLGSPMDAVLQIVSPDGFVLEQNDDDHGNDPQVVYTATADGTYYVRTFAFPAAPNSSVRFAGGADYIYRLTITTGPFVDHVRPLAVTAGVSSEVALFGWNIPETFRSIPVNAPTGTDAYDIFHPELAAPATVRVDSHPSIGETEPNDFDNPQAVSVPVTITGCLERPGDVDVYRFTAKKGDRLLLKVESRTYGQPTDPVLKLFGVDGALLKEVETRSPTVVDEELFQPIAADGDYRVEISDLYGHGGFRYAYALSIAPQEPDYRLTLPADVFKLTSGKPLEITVTVDRLYGFNDEIEITAAGLPEGVTCAPVKSTPKGTEAKTVKLSLQGETAVPFNGVIQVVGKSLGERPLEQTANAAIAGLTATTRDVWLTVAPGETPKKGD